MDITVINSDEYDDLLRLWEESVRASHHFLSEEDIEYLRPLVRNDAFPNLVLRGVRNHAGKVVGFVGISNQSVEALFVAPQCVGRGTGKALMQTAETEFNTTKVDVNEQNPNALNFYQHLGYTVVERSPLDGQGRPFPILHMEKSIRAHHTLHSR